MDTEGLEATETIEANRGASNKFCLKDERFSRAARLCVRWLRGGAAGELKIL